MLPSEHAGPFVDVQSVAAPSAQHVYHLEINTSK
jgi:hypothetical protein